MSYRVKPILALGHCAGNNHMEHPSVEVSDAAEAEDAIFPDRLQWIAKNILFSLGLSVGCVENKRCPCSLSKPLGIPSPESFPETRRRRLAESRDPPSLLGWLEAVPTNWHEQ